MNRFFVTLFFSQMFGRIPCLDGAIAMYGRKEKGQVEVELDLDIVDISSLDLGREEISVEINLIQSWNDTRCRFEVSVTRVSHDALCHMMTSNFMYHGII